MSARSRSIKLAEDNSVSISRSYRVINIVKPECSSRPYISSGVQRVDCLSSPVGKMQNNWLQQQTDDRSWHIEYSASPQRMFSEHSVSYELTIIHPAPIGTNFSSEIS
ncbi:hypothetical protein J6590_044093 [Homalodisca vitripennis]|nr:hypothetical protein J6590_044093 [Homalodisca vitripennis]